MDACPHPFLDQLEGPLVLGDREQLPGPLLIRGTAACLPGCVPRELGVFVEARAVAAACLGSLTLVCITGASREEVAGAVTVEVPGRGRGVSEHDFAYQDPKVQSVFPARGPRAGGTSLTLHGSKLLTGRLEDIRVVVGDQPCHL
ncbi:hypothetical protein Celaphus_00010582 [Cervus elaphus hippelaphus]|uniref:IPT/TIG domain-containing protein n=1 Tax=Cervus elaphus hippelaphus TaxID=46360 RepID=A0A212C9N0_CEREH|nr:hypothetical protein Celaphus_00010582 [Cervus elaphus hippelaphus]